VIGEGIRKKKQEVMMRVRIMGTQDNQGMKVRIRIQIVIRVELLQADLLHHHHIMLLRSILMKDEDLIL